MSDSNWFTDRGREWGVSDGSTFVDYYKDTNAEINPFWDELNDDDWVKRNPETALNRFLNLKKEERDRILYSNDPRIFTKYRAVKELYKNSMASSPQALQATGQEIYNRDQARKDEQQRIKNEQDRNEIFYNIQKETERNNEQNFLQRQRYEDNTVNINQQMVDLLEKGSRTPEQLLQLEKQHQKFRTELRKDEEAFKGNIDLSKQREEQLYKTGAQYLSDQLNAFANASLRSNEAIQLIANSGTPNYNWINNLLR